MIREAATSSTTSRSETADDGGPVEERTRRWSGGRIEERHPMAAANDSAPRDVSAEVPDFTVENGSMASDGDNKGVETQCSSHTDAVALDSSVLRTSMVELIDAVGGYGEGEKTLPCATTVDDCLPCLALCVGPFCCCVRSHPDQVCVPLDLFTERVYNRPLAIVTFTSFSWQAFIAYFVTLTGTDPTMFSLCGQNITQFAKAATPVQQIAVDNAFFAGLGVVQSGVLAVIFATLIGLGNSRYERRCWGWISPIVATLSFVLLGPSLSLCSTELSNQGDNGSFALYAGATTNYVSACLYTVQLFLLVLLLVQRRKCCYGSGDGAWCGPMEFSEPLPIRPLAPRSPTRGDISDHLLPGASEIQEHHNSLAELQGARPHRAQIPLRFWIVVTLSTTVVGFLAAMGALYGILLTERLREWAQRSNASISDAKAFLETLPGGNESVIYLISLLDGVSSGIGIILDNFSAVR